MEVDFLGALNAGSDINTTALVEGLVGAERAPKESAINRKIDTATAEISAYGEVLSALGGLEAAFSNLNDVNDFSDFSASVTGNNTSDNAPAFTIDESSAISSGGVYSVAVSSVATPQRIGSDSLYDSLTSSINGGNPFVINYSDFEGTITSLNVTTPTPQGIVDTINSANLGLTASAIDTGATVGGRYKLLVSSDTGASNAFTLTIGGLGATAKIIPTASVDVSNEQITLTGHGYVTGDVVTYDAQGGTAIGGLSDATTYHVIRVDANTIKLATSASNASSGTAADITGTGNAKQRITKESIGTTSTVATSSVTITTPTIATTAVSTANDTITLSSHGYSTGDVVEYRSGTGTAIGGLTNGSKYYVVRVDANTLKLATTSANATAGTQINLTGTGHSAQTLIGNADDSITISNHGFVTGDQVFYGAAGGTAIGGLSETLYSVIRIDDNSFKLASTVADAVAGTNIDLTGTGNGSQTFRGPANSLVGTASVSATNDTITMTAHHYVTGDVITYNANGGTAIAGLTDATAYHVIRVDADTIKLASSATNAAAGTNIDLTGAGNSVQSFFGGVGLSFGDSLSTASDASLTVDGVAITRTSNSVSDVIAGVTLNLNSATSSTATITVTQNTAEAETRIRSLVEAYNQAKIIFDDLATIGGSNTNSGILSGDGTLRFVESRIKDLFTGQSSTATTEISYLNDMGISFDRYGILNIDDTRFLSALSGNFGDVISMLSADTNNQSTFGVAPRGLAGDAVQIIQELVAADGPLLSATKTLEQRAKDYADDLEALDRRMTAIQARYIAQFTAMETAIDQMNSTKDFLTSTFKNMPFTNKD
ncbi:flagellar filament capping protein FliD [Litorivicinus sp.]|nr:flagellar filament capping protein FliD [Litorivicinus sp.]